MKYDNDCGYDIPRWRGLGVEAEIIYLCPTTFIITIFSHSPIFSEGP
jgi:hypothetical protein